MEKIESKEGEYIFRAGDAPGRLFLLVGGEIGIFLPSNDTNEPNFFVGSNEIFGEMGVIEDQLRMASAKCMTPCTIVAVDKEEYERLLKDANPILRGLLRLLSGRLRDIEKPSNASKVKK